MPSALLAYNRHAGHEYPSLSRTSQARLLTEAWNLIFPKLVSTQILSPDFFGYRVEPRDAEYLVRARKRHGSQSSVYQRAA